MATLKRDETGTVQTVEVDSGTVTIDNTVNEVVATVTLDEAGLVVADQAEITIPAAQLSTTEVPLNLSVERDGVEIGSLNHTDETSDATLTVALSMHYPPENDPTYEFLADVSGGSADADYSVDRGDHI